MNTSEIEALLERFYDGNTSLLEEKILRDFFCSNDVPAHLKSHQPVFAYYRNEQRHEIKDHDFEQKLTAILMEETEAPPAIRLQPYRSSFIYVTGIAAGILLLIGLFFTFKQDVFKNSLKQAGNPDTQIAYAEASHALMLVSANLNIGLKQVEKFQMVDKAMKNVRLFNKFYQYQPIFINPDETSNQSIKSK